MPPVFGVLFDGLAYGMLLFLLSVGLSVTLGMMNFVNLAHCSFAMLGGYVTVDADECARLAVSRDPAGRLRRGGRSQRRVGTRILPPASIARATSSNACSRSAWCSSRSRPRPISTAPISSRCSCRPICAARFVFAGLNFARLPAVSDRRRARDHRSAGRRLEYTRFGAQVRAAVEQSAHGARARHQCRRALRHHVRARQRACRARRRARDRRWSASIRRSPLPI